MSRIIGTQQTSFKTKEGTTITGTTIYFTDEIAPEKGKGVSADRIFVSSNKLAILDFVPTPGQEIEILYNKFGKIAKLNLTDDVVG